MGREVNVIAGVLCVVFGFLAGVVATCIALKKGGLPSGTLPW